MKLTILGSGTVVPDGSRNSAGYFIELPGARVMLDCGAGTVHALARYGLPWERMTHLFISHFHVDHVGELASLFFAFKHGARTERTEPLCLLAPEGINRVLQGLQDAFGAALFEPGFPVERILIAPQSRVALADEASLVAAKTPHTPESIAVRIEHEGRSLCYTGDTAYSEDLADFFQGCDVLISECSFRERRRAAHLAVEDVSLLAMKSRVKRLVVTHFYFPVDEITLRDELAKGFSGEVIVGRDGLVVEV